MAIYAVLTSFIWFSFSILDVWVVIGNLGVCWFGNMGVIGNLGK